ncbi:MAG: tetratricopeptide repeat protein [Dissulfurispiraceae bacterium]
MGKKSKKRVDESNLIRSDNTSASHESSGPQSLAKNTFASKAPAVGVHIACLVFFIIIIYSNTLNAPFQWDESFFIVDNPIIKNLHYFTSPATAKGFKLYTALINRYVGYLTFALNYRVHGLSVTGCHIVNIAIHIANSVLVYLFVLITFRTPFFTKTVNGEEVKGEENVNGEWVNSELKPEKKSFTIRDSLFTIHHSQSLNDSQSFIAFFSAAIFAVHPIQIEAVTYVFQRFASLVTFFYLLSLVAYTKSRLMAEGEWRKGKGNFGSVFRLQSSTVWFYIVALISAILAMKTKENAFTLPIVIVLYEFCFFSPSPRVPVSRRLRYLIPIVLTLGIIPLTLISLTGTHNLDPGAYGASEFPRWEYFFTQFRVIVTYLRLLFVPVNQNLDYDYPLFTSFFDPHVIASFLFLSALFVLGIYMITGNRHWAIGNRTKAESKANSSRFTIHDSRSFRLIGFGILWFFITLSVESSIIPLAMIITEYRVYLPSVGIIMSVVTGAFMLKERLRASRLSIVGSQKSGKIIMGILALILVVLSVATYMRNEVWGDGIRLWEDTARKSPAKARAYFALGNIYKDRNMPDKAIENYLIAIKLKPDYVEAYKSLGTTYKDRNMPDKAIENYLTAIKLKPDDADAHVYLGIEYKSLNMNDKAMEQYLVAIKMEPNNDKAHNNLGIIYQDINMTDKAIEQYLIAIRLNPDVAETHYNLGLIYQASNLYDKAVDQYLIAIKLKPGLAQAHFNLGNAYQALNMIDKAIEQYSIAIRLKPQGYAYPHFNLGLLYYKMGQTGKARQELTAGLMIKPDVQWAQQLLKSIPSD